MGELKNTASCWIDEDVEADGMGQKGFFVVVVEGEFGSLA